MNIVTRGYGSSTVILTAPLNVNTEVNNTNVLVEINEINIDIDLNNLNVSVNVED